MLKLLDFILVSLVGLGLFYKYFLFVLPSLLIFRINQFKINLESGYFFLLLSTLWGFLVIFFVRDISSDQQLLFKYLFVWALPFFLLLYKPSYNLFLYVKYLVYALLIADIFFNLYTYATGNEFLGRMIDLRPGLISSYRSGGLFAHSFYSANITIIAISLLIFNRKNKWMLVLAFLNLFLAGSARTLIQAMLILLFYWKHKTRSKFSELVQILIISSLIIFITYYFNTKIDTLESLGSNLTRTSAWDLAISKISNFPLFGSGYSKIIDIDVGVNNISTDENNIGESWYLNSSLNFGIPYTFLRFIGLILIFYGKNFNKRSNYERILIPITFIDFAYGESIESLFYSFCLWSIVYLRKFNLNTKN